jgi:peptide chain release factor 3
MGYMAADQDGDPGHMTRLQWDINRVAPDYRDIAFTATKAMMV